MIYYEPMILDRPPLLGFTCCAMSDRELTENKLNKNPLIISQIDLEKFEQFRHGICIYRIQDDAYVLRDEAEFEPYKQKEAVHDKQTRIDALKTELLRTDWYVIKCAELGNTVAETYPGIHAARAMAREEINRLETEIIEMGG